MSPFPVCLCLSPSNCLPLCVVFTVLFCSSNGFQSRSGSACSRLVCFIPTEICFWKTLTTEHLCLYVLYTALPAAKPAAATTTATTTTKATTIDSSGYRKYKYEYKHNYAGTVPTPQSTWAAHASSWSTQISILQVLIVFDLSCVLSRSVNHPTPSREGNSICFFWKSYGTFTCCVMFIVLMIHCDNCLRLDSSLFLGSLATSILNPPGRRNKFAIYGSESWHTQRPQYNCNIDSLPGRNFSRARLTCGMYFHGE